MESQALNATVEAFQPKQGPSFEFNSQGDLIERQQAAALVAEEQQSLSDSLTDDVIPLWDTPLANGMNDLMAATDDTGLEHKIISWGHVLKSTHDLARWSEKTGALRVNTQEAYDSVSDITISIEGPVRRVNPTNGSNNSNNNNNKSRGVRKNANGQQWKQKSENISSGPVLKSNDLATHARGTQSRGRNFQPRVKSEIISCGPVLKSTHDLATPAEKKSVNDSSSLEALDEFAGVSQEQLKAKSEIIGCGSVLKSTHDLATPAEKKSVNDSSSLQTLDEYASVSKGSLLKGLQAGGSGLQSGLDTQAGSHIQLDSEKVKETPEQAIKALNVHV